MNTDATDGVSDPLRARMNAIDAIAGDEPEEVGQEETPEDKPEVEEAGQPTADDDAAGTASEGEEKPEVEDEELPPAAAAAKAATHRLKIDGEEREVSEADLLEAGKRAMQKTLAADKRLEEATRLLNEARKMQQPQQPAAPQPSQDAAPPKVDAKVVKAIQYGTEEEAAEALAELMGRNTATPEDIDQRVNQRVAAVLTQQEISTRFKSDFSDVVADPDLFELARSKVQRRLDSGEPNTWETYEAAGKEVAEKFVKKQAPETALNLEEKRAKKSSVTVIKSAPGAKPAAGKDDKPETVTDIIAGMRKARHQN